MLIACGVSVLRLSGVPSSVHSSVRIASTPSICLLSAFAIRLYFYLISVKVMYTKTHTRLSVRVLSNLFAC